MSRLGRSFWLASAAVAYVCFAALQSDARALPWLLVLALPLALAEVWRRTNPPVLREDQESDVLRGAVRASAWGVALWCAARSGPTGRSAFDAAANLGTAVAAVAALVALARIGTLGGMLAPHSATRSLDAALFCAFLYSIAVGLPATRALLGTDVRLDPLAIDYATTTAAAATLLVLVVATFRLRLLRRLEVGVVDRASGALALTLTAVCVAVPAAALDVAPPDRALPFAVLVASAACTWASSTRDSTRVSTALRAILALMILGAPITTAAGLLARSEPEYSGVIVLASSVLSMATGIVARAVARPLGPEQSRWLDAIEAASRSALEPEPDSALRAALVELNKTSSVPGSRAELWRIDPPQVLSVDIAGYLHTEKGDAPERIYELALGEPERTLRAEALRALEVRRPDVRPLLAWFEARKAFSATVVVDVDGPLGFILLPAGNRDTPMTLEEVRGVRVLADRISALLAVSSALARSRERELAAQKRADEADDERQRLEHIIHHELEKRHGHAERLARRVHASSYSAKARSALERAELLGKLDAPVVLVTPPGSDAAPWAAVVHLASSRRNGALFVVDATQSFEHDLGAWEKPETSPLVKADGGTLVILDVAALPDSIQDLVALALGRRATLGGRSSVLPPSLVVSTRGAVSELVAGGQITRSLARWLGQSELCLPELHERPEDLRALVLDGLARAGLRTRGEPLGADALALHELIEHSWPGNELELDSVLMRAASVSRGSQISAADLARIGFRAVPRADSNVLQLPLGTGRRPSRRPPRRNDS